MMGTARAVCVTGMHRSGTSFIAGALQFLGVDLGAPDRHMRPGPDNPKGYFEVQAIMQLNDELLAHLGGAWDEPPVLDPGWELGAGLAPFRDRADAILADTFGPPDEWPARIAWKDPRLSLLMPFWRTVTEISATIVVVRDPVEVVASLGARGYSVGPSQAAGLWLRYLFAASADNPGRLLVRHSDIFDDLSRTVARLASHLDLPAPDADVEARVRDHLDIGLRHHDATRAAPELDNPLLELASAVWSDGDVDTDLEGAGSLVGGLLGQGWLRPPVDAELLARARADIVKARESLRKANRRITTLEAKLAEANAREA